MIRGICGLENLCTFLTLLNSTIVGQKFCLIYGKCEFVEAVFDIVCVFNVLVGIVPF